MGKVTERDIAEFAVDLTNRLCEIDEEYFDDLSQDWELRWGKFNVILGDIHDRKWTADKLLEFAADTKDDSEEIDVKEFTDNEHCVAYLVIEGDLFEKIYYHPCSEETGRYIEAFDTAAKNHNMRYDYTSGAFIFYDIDDTNAGVIG